MVWLKKKDRLALDNNHSSFLNNNNKQENVFSQLKNVSNIQNKHIPTQKGNASNY
jgi:hypothetical protein